MQLGVSSFAFGWAVGSPAQPPPAPFTETDLLAFARRHDLRVVQFGDHVPLHAFDEARLDRLRACAGTDRDGIELEIGARGLTDSHLQRHLGLARRLGSRLVRFVIDAPDYEPPADDVVALLRNAVPVLEETGTTVGIENHDRFPAKTLRRIVESAGSAFVGICLDTANSLGAGEGLEHVLDQLAPHTVNLHLKDYAITRVPYAMGFVVEGRPAGQGSLDVRAVRDRVAVFGRCRNAILETWVPPEPNLAATVAKELRWAESSLHYLKPLFAPA